ncbi:hypothetical protein GCM10022223_69560 [Kineosporia mesophila]|uniref:Erythromycin biosynthesis protein CIII-like C-terminal domain-containing protein n=1 Tax=Kineosporia mesophila TaxID=566012 RepID=A0ABP7AUT0_9ACTN|nr:nucleotide disphospho-sugar-binding domain-containing protein [Kineosporia mesophila]MCD5352356.1 hypothetical protein [Kineosporia mesophila]
MRVVLSTYGSRGDLEPLALAVGEANQQTLLARCAALVHHGGAGTTTTAAGAGVPQVIVPQVVDQPYFAGRVAELGIGVAHEGSVPTLESLTTALRTVLSPEVARRAREVAGSVSQQGTSVAAGRLGAV